MQKDVNKAIRIISGAIVVLVPLILWATASNPPLARTSAPGETTCATCHSGGAGGGSVSIAFAGGSTYSPGAAKQLTVTVSDPNAAVWGYELTAVEASATTITPGTFTAGDANSSVRKGTGTNINKFYVAQTNDAVSTFLVNWTAPAAGVGNVTFYVSAIGGDGSGDESGDSVYTSNATLTPVVVSLPNLTVSPATLSFTAVAGGAAPTAQSVATSSSGAALAYTTTSSATWLTATPASGTTPGPISVAVNQTGLTAGTYNGTVTVASAGAANTPQTVAVTFVVTAAALPTLTAAPATLSFTAQTGAAAPAAQSVAVTSSGAAVTYTTTSTTTTGGAWLAATPASSTTPGTESVSVNPTGLAAGTYTGTVSIASAGASNSPRTVAVTFVVTAAALPTLTAAPATLSFAAQVGAAAPAAQSVAVTSSGAAVTYTTTSTTTSGGAWLSATPASSTTPGTESVSVNPTGLAAGTYTGTVSIASAGASNSPRTVAVTFVVTATALPTLTAAPATLSFAAQVGAAAPAAQSVAVTSSGAAVTYTVTSTTTTGGAWLTTTPASSTTPGTESVSVNPTGLAAGTYTGTVSIASAGASNSPRTVAVTFIVTAAALPTLTLAPATLSFNAQVGGAAPPAQSVATSSSGAALSYTTTSSAAWLTASPASGTTPGPISVSVNQASLTAGTYTGTITVASTGAANSPRTVAVTFVVTAAGLPSLTVTPATLSFTAQAGGAASASKSVAVASSGAVVSYTTSSSATWLVVSPASGTTPGSISVSANPSGLTAGTYTGSVSVASAGAANSPRTVAVTFVVTAAGLPSLMASPASLSFSAQTGGTAPAAQSIAVTSNGAALTYTTTSSATWLTASPGSGSTPGTISVSVNPTSLIAGTYNGSVSIASTGAANSPQTVPVTLVVTAAGTATLKATPSTLTFYGGREMEDGLHKHLAITSSGTPLTFTAVVHGATWLSVTPSGGTTPGKLRVDANPQGLASGTYTAQILISASGATSITVPVTLVIRHHGEIEGGGERDDHKPVTNPKVFDPGGTAAVVALWINGVGVPSGSVSDPANQGLLLSNNVPSSSQTRAGVTFENVEGINLSALGFDIRQGSLCTANGPRFIVVTSDDVSHTLGGCDDATVQQAPASGWKRFRFDPAQATPSIAPDAAVKSIALMMDEGPEANSGFVLLDNININDSYVEKE